MLRVFAFVLFIIPFSSLAFDREADEFKRTSRQCNSYFQYYEDMYDIPKMLLNSIALRETGRWDKYNKKLVTWPWAVNQAGEASYFKNKNEALLAVDQMIKDGKKNIDVGCMQINLRHHPKAFDNLFQALEPRNNVEYAAIYLKKLYSKHLCWKKAVAAYHSKSSIGVEYAKKVMSIWDKIKDKEHARQEKYRVQRRTREFMNAPLTIGKKRLRSKMVIN